MQFFNGDFDISYARQGAVVQFTTFEPRTGVKITDNVFGHIERFNRNVCDELILVVRDEQGSLRYINSANLMLHV